MRNTDKNLGGDARNVEGTEGEDEKTIEGEDGEKLHDEGGESDTWGVLSPPDARQLCHHFPKT